jgi:MATE family multidrug resistance protein
MDSSVDKHGIYKKILVLALPTVAYNIIEMSLGLTDLFMVRSFGTAASAALGVNRQVTFLFEAAILALSIGVVALISQNLAKKEMEKVKDIVAQSLLTITALATALGILGYLFSSSVLVLLKASPETAAFAIDYLKIYFMSLTFLGLNAVGAAIFRAAKDPWLPLKIAIAMAVFNVPLNYGFIHGAFGFTELGVKGAAVGTLLVRIAGSAAFLVVLLRGKHDTPLVFSRITKIKTDTVGEIFRIGTPIAIAGIMRNSARVVFLTVVGFSVLGVSMHAAVGLGLQIRLLSVLPALAFQVALATLVGDAIGREKLDDADATGRHGVYLLGVIMGVLCGVIILLAEPIAHAFIQDNEGAELGAKVLRWFSLGQFFSTLAIGAQGALSGAGDTKPIARITFITQWLVLVPLAYILLVPFEIDPNGPLIAWAVSPILTFGLLYIRFLSGKWKQIEKI